MCWYCRRNILRLIIPVDAFSETYKKKETPRVQQSDNLGAFGCGQCERIKATVVG